MANIELIDQLEAWVIEQNELKQAGKPSEWDQGTWGNKTECGTACCIAGKAVQLTGYQLDYKPPYSSAWTNGLLIAWHVKDGGMISDVAREELELTPREAEVLFDEHNDLERLQVLFEALRRGDVFEYDEDEVTEDWDDFIDEGYAED